MFKNDACLQTYHDHPQKNSIRDQEVGYREEPTDPPRAGGKNQVCKFGITYQAFYDLKH